jgi:hypothetical protein
MAAISLSSATLRIFGDDADPDQISALLGCAPSNSYRKGDATYPPKNLKPRRYGMWRLGAADCEPESLDSQIVGLLNQVTQDLAIWKQVAALHEVDISCGLFMNESNEELRLSPGTLARLAERGIALDLDIYGPASKAGPGGAAEQ